MSIHINAQPGDLANTVLITGDPLRAKHTSETLMDDVTCYNEVRGMYGYTGFYKGKRVSIQGTGMGIPSTAIYVNEMINSYDVKNIIRVGTCGCLQEELGLGDIILGLSASGDSKMNQIYFEGLDFAPAASFELLNEAYQRAAELDIQCKVGGVFSSDNFYDDQPDRWKKWIQHGILGVEMESSILYTLAARHGVRALSILTVSDNIITGKSSTALEREQSYMNMMRLGLDVAPE